MGVPPTTIVVLQVAGEEDVTICHKQCSTSALTLPEVFLGKINLQVLHLEIDTLQYPSVEYALNKP